MSRSEGGTTNAQMAQLFDRRAVLALYESELVQRWIYGKNYPLMGKLNLFDHEEIINLTLVLGVYEPRCTTRFFATE